MDSFYPNACFVCKIYGKSVELKRCAKCGLVAYCGEGHRKMHWSRHKNFCRAFCAIVKNYGTMAQFAVKFDNNTKTALKTAEKFPSMVAKKLGRNLSPNERIMLLFSRSCEVCYEHDPKKLINCPECSSASFCLKHLENQAEHVDKCSVTKFRFELDRITGNMALWSTLNHRKHDYGDKTPESMDDAIEIYAANYKTSEVLVPRKIWEAVISEKLANPYTFLHALDLLAVTDMATMTIHIIDVASLDIAFDYWQSLLHHRPSLQVLRITVVGSTLKNEFRMLKCCFDCQEKERFVSLQYVEANYAAFVTGQFFSKPDFVMGFNIGIDIWLSLSTNSWKPAIKTIAQLGCPFLITSFTSAQSNNDQERINSILEKKVECFFTGPNPFPALKPYEGSENADFFFANQFLTIYKKLS